MTADNRPSAELEAIRARIGALRGAWPPVLLADAIAKDDAPRLLAALDVVLKRHYTVASTGHCVICAEPVPCSEVQAITREVAGEEKTDE